jgi:c(7)-type cytochrome triheme protein
MVAGRLFLLSRSGLSFLNTNSTLGKKFTCQSCHPDLFAKKAGEVEGREDFTMASFNQGKYCGKCHDGIVAFSVNTKCNWCHIGVQGHKHLEEYELENK